jgi:hypothetical protein
MNCWRSWKPYPGLERLCDGHVGGVTASCAGTSLRIYRLVCPVAKCRPLAHGDSLRDTASVSACPGNRTPHLHTTAGLIVAVEDEAPSLAVTQRFVRITSGGQRQPAKVDVEWAVKSRWHGRQL